MIYVHKEEWSSLQFDMDIESEHFFESIEV